MMIDVMSMIVMINVKLMHIIDMMIDMMSMMVKIIHKHNEDKYEEMIAKQ